MHRNEDAGGAQAALPGAGARADDAPGCDHVLPPAGERVLGLIINPTSRRNRKHLGRIIATAGNRPRIHYRVTEHHDEVSQGLSELAARSVNVLAISGGDGTVSRVLTHLLEERPFTRMPVIAILPGGTANMTAGDIGFRGSVHRAMRRLRDWIEQDAGSVRILRRPILRVQPGTDQPASYGMFFGAGAIVQGIEYTNANIHSRGLKHELSLGLGMARSMWGIARQDPRFIRPSGFAIGIDEQAVAPPQNVVLLLVSSLERLFLNMHPYWGEENGKPLHTTIVQSPATRLIRTLPSLLRGKPGRRLTPESGYLSYNVDKISLGFDGPFTLDGEIMHAHSDSGPVLVSNGGELDFLRIPN
ncbi:MAG: diacylglycerol kinase family protein [Gammaproteobacteria bacterium]|nr:MAG: diacylglycerol kinase family protein [Gammaproteobacteria bacterium]